MPQTIMIILVQLLESDIDLKPLKFALFGVLIAILIIINEDLGTDMGILI
jgi:hypothetical protein